MILGNARFHLTHEVRAHVSSLCVNAASHTRKERDGGSTETEASEDCDHFVDVPALPFIKQEQAAQAEHTEAHHAHAHHGAAAKGDIKRLVEAGASGVCGAHIGFGGHLHANKAGQGRAHCAHGKGEGDQRAGVFPLRHR